MKCSLLRVIGFRLLGLGFREDAIQNDATKEQLKRKREGGDKEDMHHGVG